MTVNCPVCDGQMKPWVSRKGREFWLCKDYPTCAVCLTDKALLLMQFHLEQVKKLGEQLRDVQEKCLNLSDAYRRLKRDKRRGECVGHVPVPRQLGEYVEDVAKVAIARSQRKQGGMHYEQPIRLDGLVGPTDEDVEA